MWVVKLGGSLFDDASLADWVNRIADAATPLVVVPGGGPFADQVRAAQRRWQFDDRHAHAMALLAMEQMGLMLCALHPRLVACNNTPSIRTALGDGQVPVWMPSRQVLAQRSLAADWSVTSDSLAAWLANELAAAGVLLVKSAPLPRGACAVSDLQRLDLVDAAFARHAQALACPVVLVRRAHTADLDKLLLATAQDDAMPYVTVVHGPASAAHRG